MYYYVQRRFDAGVKWSTGGVVLAVSGFSAKSVAYSVVVTVGAFPLTCPTYTS